MKRVILYMGLGIVLSCAIFLGCSEEKKAETEKGKIEEFTDKKAEELVDYVRKPIKKARDVNDMAKKRAREMDESLEED